MEHFEDKAQYASKKVSRKDLYQKDSSEEESDDEDDDDDSALE